MGELRFYNSLTRSLEPFAGPRDGDSVRIYTCGPTVYNYQHIGNMRAFLFADTLGRVLRWNGFRTRHIINITDVGHLTSDADAGDDKMERAAAAQARSIWDIAAHYTEAFKRDVRRLNIVEPAEWTVATDHIAQMIDFAQAIEGSCYRLDSGLYFDTSTVPHYGALARQTADAGESRIDPSRASAIRRTSRSGARRRPARTGQMEWDSPWGRGAPGWHLECSVMSLAHLGHPFDIHTGGIDHREIHHPNEIAQNQAHCGCGDSGAALWMHNNFLVDRTSRGSSGKMSKSSGEFLTLQALIDRGYHPLVLPADVPAGALSVGDGVHLGGAGGGSGAAEAAGAKCRTAAGQRGAGRPQGQPALERRLSAPSQARLARFAEQLADDLATPQALPNLEGVAAAALPAEERLALVGLMDGALGLDLTSVTRADLRLRPVAASLAAEDVEARLAERRDARAAKDFARSDAIRAELAEAGVEVMDGDPLGWDWKLA